MTARSTLARVVLAASLGACRTHEASTAPAPEVTVPPPLPVVSSEGGAPDGARAADTLPNVATEWCLREWRALDEGTCYLVPETFEAARPKRLLVYLSGIVPPGATSPQKENVQRVVASAARRAGAVALLPRGRVGIGPADAKDWWAWPTNVRDYAAYAGDMVVEWTVARAKLEGALGPFEHVYLAGSSSGAYFLTALALAGAVEMDGYAALSGGSVGSARARIDVKKRPFYVGYGAADATNGGPKALAAFLSSAGWPVRVAVHPGGHGAREVYLDEAFAFWKAEERRAELGR